MSKHESKDWNKFKEENELPEEELLDEALVEDSDLHEALGHPDYVALQEQLTLAEKTAHENWEKSVRAMAELDNVRRRASIDVTNAHRYGAEKLLTSLLPVVDSLQQALQLAEKASDTAMHEGLELTMKLFLDVLQKSDVQEIDPMGLPFNPQEHEAMSMQEVPGTAPNTVIAVFQKGYKLNDRLIRPARVIVSKN